MVQVDEKETEMTKQLITTTTTMLFWQIKYIVCLNDLGLECLKSSQCFRFLKLCVSKRHFYFIVCKNPLQY